MKRTELLLASIGASLSLTANTAGALEALSTNRFALAQGETQAAEFWLYAQEEAELDGTCADDLFLVAKSIRATGVMERDWWGLALETLTFSGRVAGRARLASSRTAVLDGEIGGSLLAAANMLHLDTNCVVQGDATVFGGTVISRARIEGSLSLMAARATLGGVVRGDVHLSGADLVVLPETEIGGDLFYTSPRELFLDSSVRLHGQLRRLTPPQQTAWVRPSLTQLATRQAFFYLAALLLGMVFIKAFPRTAQDALSNLRSAPWKSGLVGLLAFALLPLLGIFAIATLIGIPLGLTLIGAFVVLYSLSKPAAALLLGAFLLRRNAPDLLTLSLGLLVLYSLAALPVVGAIIWLASTALGMGGLWLAFAGRGGVRPPPLISPADESLRKE